MNWYLLFVFFWRPTIVHRGQEKTFFHRVSHSLLKRVILVLKTSLQKRYIFWVLKQT